MADLLKIRRGDVFYCEQKVQNNNSVENKTRPVVVVSNDIGNRTSTTCVVCPITTRDHTVIPAQVLYHSGTMKQVVLCEQIKTVAINSLTRYIGYLSEDVMERVNEALRIQLGLSVPEKTSPILVTPTEAKYESTPSWEDIVSKNKTEEYVAPDEVEPPKSPEPPKSTPKLTTTETSTSQRSRESQIEKFNRKYGISETPKEEPKTATEVPKKSVPKGRIFADEDEARQFVKDCETMSISEVCTKYGITPKQLYNNRYLYKKKFANETK